MTGAQWRETGLVFECAGNRLVGVAALPSSHAGVAVIILVGGPQYRVGSHRQFTLLARELAQAGIPSLRFDFTGMGDSEGSQREFSAIDEDIVCAIAALREADDSIERVVLWGLCDAASAAMMFAHRHPRVCGLVLLNPWVHGAEYSAQVKIGHYYRSVVSGSGNWKRVFNGDIKLGPVLRELAVSAWQTVIGWFGIETSNDSRHSFVEAMLNGFTSFKGDTLIILSGDDLTADEFSTLVDGDRRWRRAVGEQSVERHLIADADHTFSRKNWRSEVASLTRDWTQRF